MTCLEVGDPSAKDAALTGLLMLQYNINIS